MNIERNGNMYHQREGGGAVKVRILKKTNLLKKTMKETKINRKFKKI